MCLHPSLGELSSSRELVHKEETIAFRFCRNAIITVSEFLSPTVEHAESFAALPFNDNFVDLLIVDQIPTGDQAPDQAELFRVIRPEGVLLKRDGSGWAKTVKPANPKMDDWTHHFYDAAGNPKNNDSLAANMDGVQWYVPHENDAGSQLFAGGSLLAGGVDREAL